MTKEAAEKQVSIINQGRGPLDTVGGMLNPGQSVDVPEEVALRLTRAYPHIKLASDVVPSAKANEAAAGEAAALRAENADLKAQLKDGQEKVADLTARLQEFLEAGNKKDLDALKEKHAEAVGAA